MKNKTRLIVLFIMVGILTVYCVRLISRANNFVYLDEIKQLKLTRDSIIHENANLAKRLQVIDEDIVQLTERSASDMTYNELKAAIAEYQTYAGFSDVTGEGIIIIIDDSEKPMNTFQTPEDLIVHDINLTYLTDELREAGAEAISINGTRLVFGRSQIICKGPTISINNVKYTPPFIIKAIGDRFELARRSTEIDAYAYLLKQFGLEIEVNSKLEMTIERYSGNPNFNYAKLKE